MILPLGAGIGCEFNVFVVITYLFPGRAPHRPPAQQLLAGPCAEREPRRDDGALPLDMTDLEKGEKVEKAICEAKGYPCFLNCLCAPCVLCYKSLKIYCCACIVTYIYRLLVSVCCCLCRSICPSCYRYTDKKFPANAKSIGAWKDKSEAEVHKEIEWQRAVAFFESKLTAQQSKEGVRVKLFEDGVEPKDVAQGGLGDCWLISALACMSEHEGLLRTIFKTQEFNERGKYSIRLYDGRAKKWTLVTVDDNLPLLKGSTSLLFAQPKGQELWVVLIEKAFAKFCGNYASLDGGNEIWAFEALTGDPPGRLGPGEQPTLMGRLTTESLSYLSFCPGTVDGDAKASRFGAGGGVTPLRSRPSPSRKETVDTSDAREARVMLLSPPPGAR